MLSYRHAFHAGNHADVLKHLCLFLVLRYFNRKDKPYWYIDTHAGAGAYRFDDERAQKTGEYRDGIARVMAAENLCEPVTAFRQHLTDRLPESHVYGGSPYLAATMLRMDDRMRLFEKHPGDFPLLQATLRELGWSKHSMVQQEDGFAGLIALLPPPTRRAVTLIDPSYETADDYAQVEKTLQAALKRFADGCYMIWYPCLHKQESIRLPENLLRIAPRHVHAVLRVKGFDADGFGMAGSGMVVVNPPYVLAEELQAALPQLAELLAQSAAASYQLDVRGD
ncbi:MAG: 23S rRNA (adenine(2030)-N(6))-methyltransferase RlmJ [Neisseria sp.]|nr:23S rRNA (adenine(2030)-N(6))-methyltransferase RlmJ [Neisseria sp.]